MRGKGWKGMSVNLGLRKVMDAVPGNLGLGSEADVEPVTSMERGTGGGSML